MSKRTIYLIASTILGILIAIIIQAKIEIWLIWEILSSGNFPVRYGCWGFIPPMLSIIIILLGAAFGYAVGKRWWQIVYVEKRHWRMRKK